MLLLAGLTGTLAAQAPAGDAARQKQLLADLAVADKADAAAGELAHLGAAAVTALAAALKPAATGDVPAARTRCVELLAELGADASPALDALLDAMADESLKDNRGRILKAIGRIAPYSPVRCPEIEKRLGNECDAKGFFGIDGFFEVMSRMKFDASAEPSKLFDGLQDKNPFVRELAGEAIAAAARRQPFEGKLRGEALQRLAAVLTDDQPTNFSVEWLWNGGKATTSGGGGNPDAIRTAAALAIAAIDPSRPEALDGHRRLLHHPDPRRRAEAAANLGKLGAEAAAAANELTAALADDPRVGREAATALGQLGVADKSVLDALGKAEASGDKQLAARAKAAKRQLTPQ